MAAMAMAVAAIFAFISSACHTIDDDRIPVAPVNIVFNTVADWNIYGVAGAMDYRYFIRDLRKPSNYPYTAMTYTGFGGVLLVSDVMGNPQAYDLACPVEADKNVRVEIDDEFLAHCPKCGKEIRRQTIDQIVDLIAQGVQGIHLYTMNDPDVARRLSQAVENLREG